MYGSVCTHIRAYVHIMFHVYIQYYSVWYYSIVLRSSMCIPYMCVCVCVCVCVCLCTYVHVCMHLKILLVWVHACTYVRTCVLSCLTYVCTISTYVRTCTYKHVYSMRRMLHTCLPVVVLPRYSRYIVYRDMSTDDTIH